MKRNIGEMFTNDEVNDYRLGICNIDVKYVPQFIILDVTDIFAVENEIANQYGISAKDIIEVFGSMSIYSSGADDQGFTLRNMITDNGFSDNLPTEIMNSIEEFVEFVLEEYYSIMSLNLNSIGLAYAHYVFQKWVSPGIVLLEIDGDLYNG